jgi:hypothetical protein
MFHRRATSSERVREALLRAPSRRYVRPTSRVRSARRPSSLPFCLLTPCSAATAPGNGYVTTVRYGLSAPTGWLHGRGEILDVGGRGGGNRGVRLRRAAGVARDEHEDQRDDEREPADRGCAKAPAADRRSRDRLIAQRVRRRANCACDSVNFGGAHAFPFGVRPGPGIPVRGNSVGAPA